MILIQSGSTELSIGKDGLDWERMCCTEWNNGIFRHVCIVTTLLYSLVTMGLLLEVLLLTASVVNISHYDSLYDYILYIYI